jgi:hypothetical protein
MIFRGSIPHPMQLLCTLRDPCRQWPRNTRYQAGATPYLDRTFTGWIAPACGWRTYSITSSARLEVTMMPEVFPRVGGGRIIVGGFKLHDRRTSASHGTLIAAAAQPENFTSP